MGLNYLSIPKLQRCNRWSLGMDKKFHPIVYNECDYLSMLGLKLNPVSKRGPWWHYNGDIGLLALAQVRACCLKARSHYLNQCWIVIKVVLWHLPEIDFTRSGHEITHNMSLKIVILQLLPYLFGANELMIYTKIWQFQCCFSKWLMRSQKIFLNFTG